ncbi:Ig-like domain-containing protein [Brevibacillus sp. SIMBA_040]|uniref:Ig-like domain-containing protein n=1 Tax=unclassified Brevibacillus TaxID=2684853 RepID=UPI00397BA527
MPNNTFPESTSRSQTHTWTIPNLKSVLSVKVSSGNVSYSVNGNTISFTLTNGSITRRVQTGGSYTEADTKFVTGQTSASYNSGGYGGTLTQYVASGSYTPADTKTVSQYKGFRMNYYKKWNGTSWENNGNSFASSDTNIYDPILYNSGGYTGKLSWGGLSSTSTIATYPAPTNPTLNQRYIYEVTEPTYQYTGSVTRPESDTRVYRYEGYVTKPAVDTRTYDNYYQYTVTVDYSTNANPTVTITKPTDNQALTEGNAFQLQGSASDSDNGNVITIKYKINTGPIKALQSGVSNGSTPISFDRTLSYRTKRIYDGAADVTGADLAENTDHTLTVWAEDDQGGKSAELTRKFRVIWNRPPVISGTNTNLGLIKIPPALEYSATDPEGHSFTFTEYLNGKQLRSFLGAAGQKYSLTIDHDAWIRLDLDVAHQLKVRATDSMGLYSERIYTFTRTETHIEFMLNLANPNVRTHFRLDGKPERVLLTLDKYLPTGAVIESVKVCNNALDVSPTWEDATGAVRGGRGYLFTNEIKTAEAWCINLWVTIAKGTVTERVKLNGYGGAFD